MDGNPPDREGRGPVHAPQIVDGLQHARNGGRDCGIRGLRIAIITMLALHLRSGQVDLKIADGTTVEQRVVRLVAVREQAAVAGAHTFSDIAMLLSVFVVVAEFELGETNPHFALFRHLQSDIGCVATSAVRSPRKLVEHFQIVPFVDTFFLLTGDPVGRSCDNSAHLEEDRQYRCIVTGERHTTLVADIGVAAFVEVATGATDLCTQKATACVASRQGGARYAVFAPFVVDDVLRAKLADGQEARLSQVHPFSLFVRQKYAHRQTRKVVTGEEPLTGAVGVEVAFAAGTALMAAQQVDLAFRLFLALFGIVGNLARANALV